VLPSGQHVLSVSQTSSLFLSHNFISPELCQSPEETLQHVLTEASDLQCFVWIAGTIPFPHSQCAGTHGWLKHGSSCVTIALNGTVHNLVFVQDMSLSFSWTVNTHS
jgi:hypothetical protein